ncbi:hypothetical protein IPN41_03505 [Candidatus Falkowbacteria bacterium]|nr:MAG: hypothetical protein IPN41_03505 [Candidatus Falkowbacteria bacterium]
MLVMLTSIFLCLFLRALEKKETSMASAQKATIKVANMAYDVVSEEAFSKAYLEFVLENEHKSPCSR